MSSGNITKRGKNSWRIKFDVGRHSDSEMITRLDASFAHEKEAYGSPHTMGLLRTFAAAIGLIEEQTGKRWVDDDATAARLNTALYNLIGNAGRLLPGDDQYRREHRVEIAIDAIKSFLRLGDFELSTQNEVEILIENELYSEVSELLDLEGDEGSDPKGHGL